MRNAVNFKFALILIFFLCAGFGPKPAAELNSSLTHHLKITQAPIAYPEIVNAFPHNAEDYTEGLVYYQGYLYESTGRYNKSFLKKVEIKTGKTIKEVKLGREYFGEGMTILGNKIYQLTWKNQTGFIFNLKNFRQEGNFFYNGEGWGLTNDGRSLIMSNGAAVLSFLNPETFQVIRQIIVYDGETRISNLNELEFIHGEIWANIFYEDVIARISPETGKVLGWIDLRRLHAMMPQSAKRDENVLNGIAYDPHNDRIFVTGKLWPKMFEIKAPNRKQTED